VDDGVAAAIAATTSLREWDVNDSAATRGSEKNADVRAAIVARPLKISREIGPRCHLTIAIIKLLQTIRLDLQPEKMQGLRHQHLSPIRSVALFMVD
jgi:hypothetical protein